MAESTIGRIANGWHTASGSTKAEVLSSIDSWIATSMGIEYGYIPNAQATLLGLSSGRFCMLFKNYTNSILLTISLTGAELKTLSKAGGNWATAWKGVTLT